MIYTILSTENKVNLQTLFVGGKDATSKWEWQKKNKIAHQNASVEATMAATKFRIDMY